MQLQEIYQLLIQLGMDHDPRGRAGVEEKLKGVREAYEQLSPEEQQEFDQDALTNPYSDSRILYGEGSREVARVLVGIDIEIGEILLADRLREKGQSIDLVIAHHPEGKALAALHDVMHLQEDMLHGLGVPINVAEGLMASRIGEVMRGLAPLNHNKAVDGARILDIPMLCVHTPADNMVQHFLEKYLAEQAPKTLKDLVKALKELPEMGAAMKQQAGPKIFVGSEKNRCGKIMVDMTGGTSGSEDAYAKLAQAGVGTIVGMHIGEKHRKEAEKNHINVVIAGHLSSDSLGMNLLLDQLESRGVEVAPCSGLIRVRR